MTRRFSVSISAVLLLFATVSARAEEKCEGFLPDFGCNRQPRYEGFVAPLSMPYWFEDPFATTGASAWYVYNEFPEKGLTQGGSATVYALQLRVALTDRLSFIATQDGWMELRPDLELLEDKSGGFENWMAGLKYSLIELPEQRFILSPSLRYQAAQGSPKIQAGNGHGMWVPGVSLGWGPGSVRILGNVAAALPVNGAENSSPLFWNLHVSVPLALGFTPLVELNGIHYMSDGDGSFRLTLDDGLRVPVQAAFPLLGIAPEEGNDVLNFGSEGVTNNDIVSLTVGARMRLMQRMSLGAGWEHPITQRKDRLQNRLYINLLWEL